LPVYKKGVIFAEVWVSGLVTIATLGGSFLFLIPGLLLAIWLSVSVYSLFDEGKGGLSALASSWHYVEGYWLSVLWRFIFFVIIIFVMIIAIAVLSFGALLFSGSPADVSAGAPLAQLFNLILNNLIVLPLGIIYTYIIYKSLKTIKANSPLAEHEAKHKKTIITFIVIGIVGMILMLTLGAFFFGSVWTEFQNRFQDFPISPINTALSILPFLFR